jgi:hypothetical protein
MAAGGIEKSTPDLMVELAGELEKESERAVVVLTAAHLDYLLQRLITLTWNLPEDAEKLLFEGHNPGGDFAWKTDMAFHLGVLTQPQKDDLVLIRRMRNAFAHELVGLTFETPKIRDRCRELKSAQTDGMPICPRAQYTKAAVRLMVELTVLISQAEGHRH